VLDDDADDYASGWRRGRRSSWADSDALQVAPSVVGNWRSARREGHALERKEMMVEEEEEFSSCLTWRAAAKLVGEHKLGLLCKVETPYHDNDLILVSVISPQSGWQ
jgi:hypothetical protein